MRKRGRKRKRTISRSSERSTLLVVRIRCSVKNSARRRFRRLRHEGRSNDLHAGEQDDDERDPAPLTCAGGGEGEGEGLSGEDADVDGDLGEDTWREGNVRTRTEEGRVEGSEPMLPAIAGGATLLR